MYKLYLTSSVLSERQKEILSFFKIGDFIEQLDMETGVYKPVGLATSCATLTHDNSGLMLAFNMMYQEWGKIFPLIVNMPSRKVINLDTLERNLLSTLKMKYRVIAND